MRNEMQTMEDKMFSHNKKMQQLMDNQNFHDLQDDDHKFSNEVKSQYYEITDDGKKVTYKGDAHSSVMGDKPMNKEGVNYYTVQIDDHHNMMTLGVSVRVHNMNQQVGACNTSWGFNLSTGHLTHNGDTGVRYGWIVNEGETLTVCLDREAGTLGFYINDEDMGVAFEHAKLKTLKLFPVLSTGIVCSAKFIARKPVQKTIKPE
jgi:hypothetical protein